MNSKQGSSISRTNNQKTGLVIVAKIQHQCMVYSLICISGNGQIVPITLSGINRCPLCNSRCSCSLTCVLVSSLNEELHARHSQELNCTSRRTLSRQSALALLLPVDRSISRWDVSCWRLKADGNGSNVQQIYMGRGQMVRFVWLSFYTIKTRCNVMTTGDLKWIACLFNETFVCEFIHRS